MRRVIQAIPNSSTNANNFGNKQIYTRLCIKPQIYPTTFQSNQPHNVEATCEEENINNYISNLYKINKYRDVLNPATPNNNNIFIDTNSEHQIRNQKKFPKKTKKVKIMNS